MDIGDDVYVYDRRNVINEFIFFGIDYSQCENFSKLEGLRHYVTTKRFTVAICQSWQT